MGQEGGEGRDRKEDDGIPRRAVRRLPDVADIIFWPAVISSSVPRGAWLEGPSAMSPIQNISRSWPAFVALRRDVISYAVRALPSRSVWP